MGQEDFELIFNYSFIAPPVDNPHFDENDPEGQKLIENQVSLSLSYLVIKLYNTKTIIISYFSTFFLYKTLQNVWKYHFFLQKFIKSILYHCVSFSKYDFHLILCIPFKKKHQKPRQNQAKGDIYGIHLKIRGKEQNLVFQ